MGRRTVLAVVLLILGMGGTALAHSLTYESETSPLFCVSLPQDWTLRTSGCRVVAAPADSSMWLGVWRLEEHTSAQQAEEDAADYLSAWFQEVQAAPAQRLQVNGMPAVRIDGTAVYEGNPVRFAAVIFEPGPKVVCAALGLWDDETQARMGPIEAALGSLRPAPGGFR